MHSASTACRLTVSDSISLPCPGFFSPFPHGTSSLSVIEEYLVLESGLPRFPTGFTCPVVLGIPLGSICISSTGLSPCFARLSRLFDYTFGYHIEVPQPLIQKCIRFRLSPVRSPLLGESLLISFPEGTEMFHFPSFAFLNYEFV